MPELWIPGAVKYPIGLAGSLTGGPAKCTLHTTESYPEKTSAMDVCRWMASTKPGSVYTLIYHPISGQMVQMLAANGSAKALSNIKGGVETNRRGRVHIQVSVVAHAADPFTKYPLPGWARVVDWVESWGVPRLWYGQPPRCVLDPLSSTDWNNGNGWAGHCCCPEQTHHDPGAIDLNVLFSGKTQTPPSTQPGTFTLTFDGGATVSLRYLKRTDPMMKGGDVKSLQGVLNQKGFNAGSEDGVFGDGTATAVGRAQAAMGLATDKICGPATMEGLWER